jgi:hypothetical protein
VWAKTPPPANKFHIITERFIGIWERNASKQKMDMEVRFEVLTVVEFHIVGIYQNKQCITQLTTTYVN